MRITKKRLFVWVLFISIILICLGVALTIGQSVIKNQLPVLATKNNQKQASSTSISADSHVKSKHDNHSNLPPLDVNGYFHQENISPVLAPLNNKHAPIPFIFTYSHIQYRRFLVSQNLINSSKSQFFTNNLLIAKTIVPYTTNDDNITNVSIESQVLKKKKNYQKLTIDSAKCFSDNTYLYLGICVICTDNSSTNVLANKDNETQTIFFLFKCKLMYLCENNYKNESISWTEETSFTRTLNPPNATTKIHSWIYFIAGDNEKGKSYYPFAIGYFTNIQMNPLEETAPPGYINLTSHSIIYIKGESTNLWKKESLYTPPIQHSVYSEVDCQAHVEMDVNNRDKKKSTNITSEANESQTPFSSIYNNNDTKFFWSDLASPQINSNAKSNKNRNSIYFIRMTQINNFINVSRRGENKNAVNVFFDGADSSSQSQYNTIDQLLRNHFDSAFIRNIKNLQFDVQGNIFFLVTVGAENWADDWATYLCIIKIDKNKDGTISDKSSINQVYKMNDSQEYKISSQFLLSENTTISENMLKSTNMQIPDSNLFLIERSTSTLNRPALFMFPVAAIISSIISPGSTALLKISKFAIISDIGTESASNRFELSIMPYNLQLAQPQSEQNNNGDKKSNNTIIWLHEKGEPTNYAWKWQSAKEYLKKQSSNNYNNDDIHTDDDIYYDSYHSSIIIRTRVGVKMNFNDPTSDSFTIPRSFKATNWINRSYNYYDFYNIQSRNSASPTALRKCYAQGPLTIVLDNDLNSNSNHLMLNDTMCPRGAMLLSLSTPDLFTRNSLIYNNNTTNVFKLRVYNNNDVGDPKFVPIDYIIDPGVYLNSVNKFSSGTVGNPSSLKTDFLQYIPNSHTYSNIHKRTTIGTRHQSFFGDLITLNYQMNTAGNLANYRQDYFSSSERPLGFYFFFNINSVTLNLKNLFQINSENNVRLVEVIPIKNYSKSSTNKAAFSGDTSQRHLFYYARSKENGPEEYYDYNANSTNSNQGEQITGNAWPTFRNSSEKHQNSIGSKAERFNSSNIETLSGGAAGLFLVNFYNLFNTSVMSVFIQVGGNSPITHINYLTNIAPKYFKWLANIGRDIILGGLIGAVSVWVIFILSHSFFLGRSKHFSLLVKHEGTSLKINIKPSSNRRLQFSV